MVVRQQQVRPRRGLVQVRRERRHEVDPVERRPQVAFAGHAVERVRAVHQQRRDVA